MDVWLLKQKSGARSYFVLKRGRKNIEKKKQRGMGRWVVVGGGGLVAGVVGGVVGWVGW